MASGGTEKQADDAAVGADEVIAGGEGVYELENALAETGDAFAAGSGEFVKLDERFLLLRPAFIEGETFELLEVEFAQTVVERGREAGAVGGLHAAAEIGAPGGVGPNDGELDGEPGGQADSLVGEADVGPAEEPGLVIPGGGSVADEPEGDHGVHQGRPMAKVWTRATPVARVASSAICCMPPITSPVTPLILRTASRTAKRLLPDREPPMSRRSI